MQQLKSGPLSEGASTVSIGLVEDRTVAVAAVVPEVSLPLPVVDEARSDLAVNYGLEYSILRTEEGRLLEKRKLLYYIFAPLMYLVALWNAVKHQFWLLFKGRRLEKTKRQAGPQRMSWLFDKAHKLGGVVRGGVTTSQALGPVYALPLLLPNPKGWREWLMWFWLNQPDAQGPRNRLRMTYEFLLKELDRLYKGGVGMSLEFPIRIFSLACGSANATIEAIHRFTVENPGVHVELTLVDTNENSLNWAKELAQHLGLRATLIVRKENIWRFIRTCKTRAHAVEMVGYIDYHSSEKISAIFTGIAENLLYPDGLLITALIAPCFLSPVVRWVTGWYGLRRYTQEQFEQALLNSSFGKTGSFKITGEPTRTHNMAQCRTASAK